MVAGQGGMLPPDVIREFLIRTGPVRSGLAATRLSMSASGFRRALRSFGDELLRTGAARATTIALRREVEGVRTPVPLFQVDGSGAICLLLQLHPVQPFGYYVEGVAPGVESGFHAADPSEGTPTGLDLPWFLVDVKPEGFLGRHWLREHPDEGYPMELTLWSGDDVLRYACHHGIDLPGAFVLGAFARGRLDEGMVRQRHPHTALPELARRAIEGGGWGSSPGGEQPKFPFVDPDGRHQLVKFSPPVDTAVGRRWADLLAAEHLAHEVLRDHGVAAAHSAVVDAGGRRFLCVQRFDRHGERGRSGLVSLLALDRSGVGSELRRWSLVTADLLRQGKIDAATHAGAQWLEAFGHLIANSDMHMGNLSLAIEGTTLVGLAPVYDMLPMAFAPRFGEVVNRAYEPHAHLDVFPSGAVAAARDFWQRVGADERVSDAFNPVAAQQLARLPTVDQ